MGQRQRFIDGPRDRQVARERPRHPDTLPPALRDALRRLVQHPDIGKGKLFDPANLPLSDLAAGVRAKVELLARRGYIDRPGLYRLRPFVVCWAIENKLVPVTAADLWVGPVEARRASI